MTTDRETTRIVRSWLEEGVTSLPDPVLDRVLDQLPSTPQRRPTWGARRFVEMNTIPKLVAAAAVVAVALVGLSLRPSDGPGPGTSAAPLPSESPLPTDRVVQDGPLSPGRWTFISLPPLRITFTVPSANWQKNLVPNVIWTRSSEARLGFADGDNPYADPCNWGDGALDPPVGPGAAEYADALAALPGLEVNAESTTAVDGYPARYVELIVPSDQSECRNEEMFLEGDSPLEPGRHRFWVVDVDGIRLVAFAVDRVDATAADREELDALIDSIEIRAP